MTQEQRDQQAAREAEQMDQQIEHEALLQGVISASAMVGAYGQERTAAITRRDAKIRAAFEAGVNRQAIAKAAGMRRERVYQIIDGR